MRDEISFEAHDKPLSDVLFLTGRRYRVPRYQRPYSWGIEHVSQFWEDLVSNDEPYFFGSFIFNTEPEREHEWVDIIDGQQRLLTVTILCAVIRDIAKTLDPDRAGVYQRHDIAIEDREGRWSFRILPADTLADYFLRYVQKDDDSILASKPTTPEEKRVKENYAYLHERIYAEAKRVPSRDSQLESLDKLRRKVAELIVISVEIAREEDAFEIFETTNARGLDLSVGDLLKNLIFRKIPASGDHDLAKDVWQEITSDIESTNTELRKFIRYFWISKYAFVPEKRLYREIKNKTIDWDKLLDDLWKGSDWYNKLLEGNEDDFEQLKQGSVLSQESRRTSS